jgi:hypothetical protein
MYLCGKRCLPVIVIISTYIIKALAGNCMVSCTEGNDG